MRKITLVLVAATLLSTGSIFANSVKDIDPGKSLSTQISKILSDNEFSDSQVNMTAQVRFTVNKDGEIVVLSVDTESPTFESFVKGRLNYKKVGQANFKEGKLFTVSVRIVA